MLFPALALLLWTSPPRRASVRVLLLIGTGYALLWMALPGNLVDETLKAWLLIGTALFVPLALRRRLAPIDAALLAGAAAAGAVLAWYALHGIAPRVALVELEHQIRAMYRLFGDLAPAERDQFNAAADQVVPLLVTTPAVTMLLGVSGLLTAWRWYQALAADPVGGPPAPFAEFRFSDHLVWILIAGLAGLAAQAGEMLSGEAAWPANLLLFTGGLYVVRGAAVIRWRTGAWSGPLLLVALITVLFLAPVVLTACFGLGLADTWLDFRRPSEAPSGD